MMFILFSDLVVVEHIFLSPQVKWKAKPYDSLNLKLEQLICKKVQKFT